MPKRPGGLSKKLLLVFLLVGLVPFLLVSLWTYNKARDRMTETVIQYWLVRQARETADRLDAEVREAKALIRSWADDDSLEATLKGLESDPVTAETLDFLTSFLERRRKYRSDLDLLLLVDSKGTILAESWVDRDGVAGRTARLRQQTLQDVLPSSDEREWIELALSPRPTAQAQNIVPITTHDWHLSPLVSKARGESPIDVRESGYPSDTSSYAIGLAGTVRSADRTRAIGALVGIFNWNRVQDIMDDVTRRFQQPDEPGASEARYRSGYPFLFALDFDTIIAHEHRKNIGTSLSRDHHLPDFREKMQKARYGSYGYSYREHPKISGFAWTARPTEEGFGWTVGVGINSDEIYADVLKLRDFMIIAGLLVTALVTLLALLFSHRLTEPILRLTRHTQRLSRGELDTRVDIHTRDEIQMLAESFNRMAADLKESNQKLIHAEKDAAWSEMARQVAHEIKNPLTPIMLSAQHLERAHEDDHPEFGSILKDSVETIIEQCQDLKKIAADFMAFARFPTTDLKAHSVRELVDDSVEIYKGRASNRYEIHNRFDVAPNHRVMVDADQFRRVFLNLFNNAIEAMPDGGTITVTGDIYGSQEVEIRIQDTGLGIAPANRDRLFEPNFSTRTGGTGLGLAMVKRIIDEARGKIRLESDMGKGTTFLIRLPLHVSTDED